MKRNTIRKSYIGMRHRLPVIATMAFWCISIIRIVHSDMVVDVYHSERLTRLMPMHMYLLITVPIAVLALVVYVLKKKRKKAALWVICFYLLVYGCVATWILGNSYYDYVCNKCGTKFTESDLTGVNFDITTAVGLRRGTREDKYDCPKCSGWSFERQHACPPHYDLPSAVEDKNRFCKDDEK